MRRLHRVALLVILAFLLAGATSAQLPEQINPRIPPPPPPEAISPPPMPAPTVASPSPPVDLPEVVRLPEGTRVEVILETPMSTRITKTGQAVTFRSVNSIRVDERLAIPPDTAFTGKVLFAKKPGGFGRGGEIRVAVERLELSGGVTVPVVARLESAELDAQGRATGDSRTGANLLELAQWSLTGTLIGSRMGKKEAGYGAAAGAFAALVLMMSRRGADVYIEPGTPFRVILERPVELPGREVYAAQENYARLHPTTVSDVEDGNAAAASPADGIPDSERPKLKRRPKR